MYILKLIICFSFSLIFFSLFLKNNNYKDYNNNKIIVLLKFFLLIFKIPENKLKDKHDIYL